MTGRDSLAEQIVRAIQQVVASGPVPLHEPKFGGNEWAYVKECLDTGIVSSIGPFVDRFEHELIKLTGAKHCVAVVNGTAALHAALHLMGVQPGDEVIVPTLTFVATANAVAYCGAVPHFADVDERTLGLDPGALREYLNRIAERREGLLRNRATNRVIRAILPMHTFGHPLDIQGVLDVARDFELAVVEDAAEAIGSTIGDRHAGTFGQCGTLSFNGNKTLTTGGGGAILTDDPDLARRAKHLTTTAKTAHPWEFVHDEVGFNYRMPNINAALGCAQLEQLAGFLTAKRTLFERYRAAFAPIPHVRLQSEPLGCRSNYWLQTLVLDPSVASERDAVLSATNAAGFGTRPVWRLMHRLAPYRECPKMSTPVAESLEARIVNLPSSARLAC